MTQSKMNNDEYVITLDSGETLDLNEYISGAEDIVVNVLDDTMNTTTYWAGDSVTDITLGTSASNGTFTISSDSVIDTFSWDFGNKIDPDEVAKMCKEYPGLEKVWRNFKSVYDMCKQDFEGKKKAGELDDDIPF